VLFEQREPKDFAESVVSSGLREGRVYLSVQFLDNDMVIPVIETLVYIGKDLRPDDSGKFYFQDARSFRRGVPHTRSGNEAIVHAHDERNLTHIFEYEKALEVLMTCSLRRRRRGVS